jgi:hypothetical protein
MDDKKQRPFLDLKKKSEYIGKVVSDPEHGKGVIVGEEVGVVFVKLNKSPNTFLCVRKSDLESTKK